MADNVAITAGSGTSIATDEIQVSGTGTLGHVQYVKLVDGTLNGTTPVGCSSAGALFVGGSVAHDAGDAGNPIKVGGVATASVAGQTLVAAADRTNLYAGTDGVLIVRPDCSLEDIVTGNASNTDGTSFQVIAAGAAGVKHYLRSCTLTNTSTAMTYCEIKDGTTVKWTIPVPAQGGATVRFDPPIPGTAATAWNCDPGAATTTIYCSLAGFKSKA